MSATATALRVGDLAVTIFVIESRIPEVDKGCGDPRAALIGQVLASIPGVRVVWLADDRSGRHEYGPAMEAWGIDIGNRSIAEELSCRRGEADIVVVARPENFELAQSAIAQYQPQAHRVYDMESLFHLRQARSAAFSRHPRRSIREAERLERVERRAIAWADSVLCVSERERQFASDVNPGVATAIAGYAVEASQTRVPRTARVGVAFFGSFRAGISSPNGVGARVAARDVQPLLGRPIAIAGACIPREIADLASDTVAIVGPVPAPAPFLASLLVLLCPMPFGSGLNLRFVEAAGVGTPFVTSPIGAEALAFDRELRALLVGESPAALASLTRALLDDESRWQAASDGVHDLALRRHGFAPFTDAVRTLVTTAAACRTSGGPRAPLETTLTDA